ncbi:hypothetical protein C2G38_2216105 [Gigaspora rosea]|uniref:Uncharacterized protein n=1 Tax=Gigaspora rosea TaxID=44941 RepID=A0A397U9J3_9GLOM|nr:hypothetical protein C2G38_2216105 [Gigaspora rosea]
MEMIDHINRSGLDNREYNLNKTTPRENALNHFVGMKITNANQKIFILQKKRTSEQAKQQCIKFKLKHDKIVENLNGYN